MPQPDKGFTKEFLRVYFFEWPCLRKSFLKGGAYQGNTSKIISAGLTTCVSFLRYQGKFFDEEAILGELSEKLKEVGD